VEELSEAGEAQPMAAPSNVGMRASPRWRWKERNKVAVNINLRGVESFSQKGG